MNIFKFYIRAFAPIFVMISLAFCLNLLKITLLLPHFKSITFILLTLLSGLLLYSIILKLGLKQKAPSINWGKISHVIASAFFATIAVALGISFHSLFSGALINFQLNKWNPSFFWLCSSLLAPLIEELGFRAGLLRLLLPRMTSRSAVIFSATVFAIMHLLNIFIGSKIDGLQILGCFEVGIILGIIYLRSGLFSAIAFHWFWNLMQVALLKGVIGTKFTSVTMFEGLTGVLTVLTLTILGLNFNFILHKIRKAQTTI